MRGRVVTYEARTMSLPHGEIDAEPTGLSRRNDPSCPKVRLSKADVGPLSFSSSISYLEVYRRPPKFVNVHPEAPSPRHRGAQFIVGLWLSGACLSPSAVEAS